MKDRILKRSKIDYRTLAVFRVFAGILIIIDILLRSRNLNTFYTENGLLSEEIIAQGTENSLGILLFGDSTTVIIVFCIQILFALLLIIGYKTRLAIVISFLLVVTIDSANPFVTSYADTLFRYLLFWAMFLPLGYKWSVDSALSDKKERNRSSVEIIASAMILIQMFIMYFVNGFKKFQNHDSWINGDAIISILHYERVTFFLTEYVLLIPDTIIALMGLYWYIFLLVLSWFLIITVGRARYVIAIGFAIGHLGLALTTRIGAFSFVSILGLILFFQSEFWDDISKITSEGTKERLKAYSEFLSSKVDEFPYIGFEIVRPLIDRKEDHIIIEFIEAIIIIIVITMAIATFFDISMTLTATSSTIDSPDRADMGIQPEWNFFTQPRTSDRYYVFVGETKSGDVVDILNGGNIKYSERPHGGDLEKQFETYRHRFYFTSFESVPEFAPEAANYYCNNWGDERELVRINMYRITESMPVDKLGNIDKYPIENARLRGKFGCDEYESKFIHPPQSEEIREHMDIDTLMAVQD